MDLHRRVFNKRTQSGMTAVISCVLFFMLAIFARSVHAGAVCAEVKIEIKQELTLERQAFIAEMRINNGLDGISLENVDISVVFKDETGDVVEFTEDPGNITASFFVKVDNMTGIADIGGAGVVAPLTSADVSWLIIPSKFSSQGIPSGKLYFVSASLSYTVGGEPTTVEVSPDTIYVKPLPKLTMDYFLTQDVFADDAFTENVVEPAEPFTLGVRVKNNGFATASNVQIDSAQPQIIANDGGLLIGFNIIDSFVNNLAATNSLKINLGDIPGGSATMGRWGMVTTLSGKFTEFTAEFSHADELGGALTSILEATNAHFLIRNVLVDEPGRDNILDFLGYPTNGVNTDLHVYESSGEDFEVINQTADSTMVPTASGVVINPPQTAGFMYVKFQDPYNGTKSVLEAIRSDGKYIPLANAWASKTRNEDSIPPSWEYWINLFDSNTTTHYTLTMGSPVIGPVAPVFDTINNRTTYEGNPLAIAFPVSASDANGDVITLSAPDRPSGANFVDNGNGSGNFSWTPGVGTANTYYVTFFATDVGGLKSNKTITIKVNPATDTDGDGMPDQWELDHFGDLSHDGTADTDGDGVTDYNEYLAGTDPNLNESARNWDVPSSLGAAAAEVSSRTSIAVDANGMAVAVWQQTNGARTDIWSNSYVPGIGWGVPQLVETDDIGNAHTPLVKLDSTGNAMAVWLQSDGSRDNLMSSYLPFGGAWSAAVLVENNDVGNAGAHSLAVANNNDFVVIWAQADGTLDINSVANPNTVYVSRYAIASGWAAATRIENNSVIAALGTQIAVDATGDMVAVWSETMDGTTYNIQSNSFTDLSGWGSAQLLRSGAFGDTLTTQVVAKLAMNSNGDAVIVWAEASSPSSIWAQQYSVASGWGAVFTLENDLDAAYQADVAIHDNGNIVAVFAQHDGTRYSIRAADYNSIGGWSAATLIGTTATGTINGDAARPTVAMDSAGNAMVAWQQTDGYEDNLWANNFTAGGTGWATSQIIENINPGDATSPALAVVANGNALVVWQQASATGTTLAANTYLASNAGLPNIVPVVITANTLIADEQTSVLLDAASSFDQDGSITTYDWVQTAGPAVVLSNSATATAGFTAPTVLLSEGPQVLSFMLTLTDDASGQSSGLVDVTVNPVNANPTVDAGADQTLDELTLVTLTGSAVDSDGTIATYSWIQTAGPVITLSGATTTSASFTAPQVLLSDGPQLLSFVLIASDDEGASSADQIYITVNPVNTAPTANAGVDQTVDEQTTVTLNGSAVDADGSVVSYSWTQISGKAVVLASPGSQTTTFTAPRAFGVFGPEVVVLELTVSDNEGASSSDQISVTANPVNLSPPTANAGPDLAVDEQTVVYITGYGIDSDVTAMGDWTQVSGIPVVLTQGGGPGDRFDGIVRVRFTSPEVSMADGPQTLVLRLIAWDLDLAYSEPDDVIITVNPVNAAPTVNAGADQVVNEQTGVTMVGSASDSDGTIAAYSWSQSAGPAVTLAGGSTATASFTAPVVLSSAGPQILSFVLTATDNEGGSGIDQINITVNPVNSAPTANLDWPTTDEDTPAVLDVLANDTDPDGDTLSVSYVQTTSATGGTVSLNVDGTITYTPAYNFHGSDSFTYTVTDGHGGTSSSYVLITVNPVNDAPVGNLDWPTTDEDTPVVVDVLANDTDSDGDTLSVTYVQSPSAAGGTASLNADGTVTYTPPLNFTGGDNFKYTVSDGKGGVAGPYVLITINAVNDAPVIPQIPDQGSLVDQTLSLAIDATDVDSASLTYSATGLPDGLSIDSETGVISGTTSAISEGSYAVSVMVTDGFENASASFTWTVAQVATSYTILNPRFAGAEAWVVSLSDNNIVVAGDTVLLLNRYERGHIPAGVLAQGMVISGAGTFDIASNKSATGMPLSDRMAGTSFVMPHVRYTHWYYLVSPDGDATVQINVNGVISSLSLLQGQVVEFNAGYDALGSARITSDLPILVAHSGDTGTAFADASPVPPAALDLSGMKDTFAKVYIVALEDNTRVRVFDSSSAEFLVTLLNAGDRYEGGLINARVGVRFIADKPIGAIQVDGSDGADQLVIMPSSQLGVRFGLPTDTEYAFVVCSTTMTTVTLYDGVKPPRSIQCSNYDANFSQHPGSAYFGPVSGEIIKAGAYIETSQPVSVSYKDALTNTERNLMGEPEAITYTILNRGLVGAETWVVSLSDNNIIRAGNTELRLNRYERGKIPAGVLTQGMVVSGKSAFDIGSSTDATDVPLSNRMLGTQFVMPQTRDIHLYSMVSPKGDAVVQVNVNGVVTSLSLPQGQVVEFNAGSDAIGTSLITSDLPILVAHRSERLTSFADASPMPPAATSLWGIRGFLWAYIAAVEDNTSVTVSAADGTRADVVLHAGQRYTVDSVGVEGGQGMGSALWVRADKPVSAIQILDGDGIEQTAFMPRLHLGVRFGLPTDTQYVAVVCPRSSTIVTLYDGVKPPESILCPVTRSGPGKGHFGSVTNGVNIGAGAHIEASEPIYIIYEDALTNDEHNLMGTQYYH